jgi:adenine-specific DNA-methyltransferase
MPANDQLFPDLLREQNKPAEKPNERTLSQWYTPAWAAEMLWDAHFSDLGANDLVWEPTCGSGNCLAAIPEHIGAIGSEIDALEARKASLKTGRPVLVGDCRTVALPHGISAVFGNPPFELDIFEGLLDRCASILQNGQKAGFVLPAYFTQTSRTVMPWTKTWTIMQEGLPRDLFPGLSKPLIFGLFTRDYSPRLIGFRLFPEMAENHDLPEAVREKLANGVKGPRSVWRETVIAAMERFDGKASLAQIYAALSGKRPTSNAHWREQVRKVLRDSRHFLRVDDGVYTRAAAA